MLLSDQGSSSAPAPGPETPPPPCLLSLSILPPFPFFLCSYCPFRSFPFLAFRFLSLNFLSLPFLFFLFAVCCLLRWAFFICRRTLLFEEINPRGIKDILKVASWRFRVISRPVRPPLDMETPRALGGLWPDSAGTGNLI